MSYPTKKLGESKCVRRFLRNRDYQFSDEEVVSNHTDDDVVDVLFQGKRFQVVHANFDFQKKINTVSSGRMIISSNTQQSTWQKFILEPIRKKNKYGKAANGVILLIDSYTEPPWIEKQLQIAKKIGFDNELKKYGFDEIYLVCPQKNIKIFQ